MPSSTSVTGSRSSTAATTLQERQDIKEKAAQEKRILITTGKGERGYVEKVKGGFRTTMFKDTKLPSGGYFYTYPTSKGGKTVYRQNLTGRNEGIVKETSIPADAVQITVPQKNIRTGKVSMHRGNIVTSPAYQEMLTQTETKTVGGTKISGLRLSSGEQKVTYQNIPAIRAYQLGMIDIKQMANVIVQSKQQAVKKDYYKGNLTSGEAAYLLGQTIPRKPFLETPKTEQSAFEALKAQGLYYPEKGYAGQVTMSNQIPADIKYTTLSSYFMPKITQESKDNLLYTREGQLGFIADVNKFWTRIISRADEAVGWQQKVLKSRKSKSDFLPMKIYDFAQEKLTPSSELQWGLAKVGESPLYVARGTATASFGGLYSVSPFDVNPYSYIYDFKGSQEYYKTHKLKISTPPIVPLTLLFAETFAEKPGETAKLVLKDILTTHPAETAAKFYTTGLLWSKIIRGFNYGFNRVVNLSLKRIQASDIFSEKALQGIEKYPQATPKETLYLYSHSPKQFAVRPDTGIIIKAPQDIKYETNWEFLWSKITGKTKEVFKQEQAGTYAIYEYGKRGTGISIKSQTIYPYSAVEPAQTIGMTSAERQALILSLKEGKSAIVAQEVTRGGYHVSPVYLGRDFVQLEVTGAANSEIQAFFTSAEASPAFFGGGESYKPTLNPFRGLFNRPSVSFVVTKDVELARVKSYLEFQKFLDEQASQVKIYVNPLKTESEGLMKVSRQVSQPDGGLLGVRSADLIAMPRTTIYGEIVGAERSGMILGSQYPLSPGKDVPFVFQRFWAKEVPGGTVLPKSVVAKSQEIAKFLSKSSEKRVSKVPLINFGSGASMSANIKPYTGSYISAAKGSSILEIPSSSVVKDFSYSLPKYSLKSSYKLPDYSISGYSYEGSGGISSGGSSGISGRGRGSSRSYPSYPSIPSLPSYPSYPSLPSYPSYPSLPSYPSYPSRPSRGSYPSYPNYPSRGSSSSMKYFDTAFGTRGKGSYKKKKLKSPKFQAFILPDLFSVSITEAATGREARIPRATKGIKGLFTAALKGYSTGYVPTEEIRIGKVKTNWGGGLQKIKLPKFGNIFNFKNTGFKNNKKNKKWW